MFVNICQLVSHFIECGYNSKHGNSSHILPSYTNMTIRQLLSNLIKCVKSVASYERHDNVSQCLPAYTCICECMPIWKPAFWTWQCDLTVASYQNL